MKTVTQIIDEVREQMCNEYCKYTAVAVQLLDESTEEMDKICGDCPLNRL